jgi:hypothetical protein
MQSHIGKICPYCQTPLKPGVPATICGQCDIPHHTHCWYENGGCTTYGCAGMAAVRIGRTGEATPEPAFDIAQDVIDWEGWDDFRLPPILTVVLIVIAVLIFIVAAALLLYLLIVPARSGGAALPHYVAAAAVASRPCFCAWMIRSL